MTIRETAEGRQALLDAATANGRSLSDEISRRLRNSFRYETEGEPVNIAFLELLGAHIREIEAETGLSWRLDPGTWRKVRDALLREIETRAPAPAVASQIPQPQIEVQGGLSDE